MHIYMHHAQVHSCCTQHCLLISISNYISYFMHWLVIARIVCITSCLLYLLVLASEVACSYYYCDNRRAYIAIEVVAYMHTEMAG